MLNVALGKMQRLAARSPLLVRLAVALRNQAEAVIGYRMADTIDPRLNGEGWLMKWAATDCRVFIDVGANVGNWSAEFLPLCCPEVKGILLEPSRNAFQTLQGRHGEDPRLTLVPAAVGDRSGSLTFYEEPDAGETSSLVRGQSRPTATPRTVDVTTVDEVIARNGCERVDLLKVDTEGYDLNVLRGAAGALAAGTVRLIQFEYNACWAQAGATLSDAFRFLTQFNYPVYLLRRDGLYELDYDRYGEFYRYSNFVAVAPAVAAEARSRVRGRV